MYNGQQVRIYKTTRQSVIHREDKNVIELQPK